MDHDIRTSWHRAADVDATLKLRDKFIPALQKKRVAAGTYSRKKLFQRMVRGEIALFKDFSVPLTKYTEGDKRKYLTDCINSGFTKSQRVRIQTGRSRSRRMVNIQELMRRWESERNIASVTDLHFRGTKFARALDVTQLSDFNVLCSDRELIENIEMMTLVVSSKGNFTDSHADDCDGSNHCFLGRKLWLAWDRIEGRAKGFQDADRDAESIIDQAAFDLETFISLQSSRWLLVNENETLFLPGKLAHKVVTLKHYIGVGSFHVALPGYVWSLKRWIIHDTVDIGPRNLLSRINRAVVRRISELKSASDIVSEASGFRYMQKANELWRKSENPETKARLLSDPIFAAFIETASSG